MNVFVIIILIFSFVVVFKIKVEAELFLQMIKWFLLSVKLPFTDHRGGGGGVSWIGV